MTDPSLSEGRALAELIRFSEDRFRGNQPDDHTATDHVRGIFAQNDLEISAAVTPDLAHWLTETYKQLLIPESVVKAFVYASPELQAECFSKSRTECVLRFSSSLIDLLDEDEIRFVTGHELGHFLLSHGKANSATKFESLEFYMQRRYQEISADRLGLMACQSLDTAISVLIKTASGLSNKFLRFDIKAFLGQLEHVGEEDLGTTLGATHPSILVRARALLWFSMGGFLSQESDKLSSAEILRLDKRVRRDLERYVDRPAQRQLDEAKDQVILWLLAEQVVRSGTFNKTEQMVAHDLLGEETMQGLRRFLADLDSGTATDEVGERLSAAIQDLETLIPNGAGEELPRIRRLVNSRLR